MTGEQFDRQSPLEEDHKSQKWLQEWNVANIFEIQKYSS